MCGSCEKNNNKTTKKTGEDCMKHWYKYCRYIEIDGEAYKTMHEQHRQVDTWYETLGAADCNHRSAA